MITGLLFSVIPPFYPLEAEARGLGPMQYGAVFAAEHLACLARTFCRLLSLLFKGNQSSLYSENICCYRFLLPFSGG